REYMTRVRKKSFLVITFVVPVLMALLCIVPSVIMLMSKDKCKTVEVVDESGIVLPYLTDNDIVVYKDCTGKDLDSLKAGVSADDGIDAVLHISAYDPQTRNVTASIYSVKPVGIDIKEDIGSKAGDAVEDCRMRSYDIENLDVIMQEIKAEVSVATYTLGEDGQEKITSSEVYMIISLVLTMVIYMFIAMFSGMVMSSVIEEKSSKVVEVLVSSVKSIELMFGKIIGVACVALTQFFLWIVLAFVLVSAAGLFVDFDSITQGAQQMTEMASVPGMDAVDPTAALMQAAEDNPELSAVLSTLKDLDYGSIIFSFVIYFVLGYLLYASLFAAIGSAVENEGDSNQLQMPVTIPLLIGFFIAFYAFKAPDSQLAFWGSMIPFTSPMVMLARIPFGVPLWELALSIGLLLVTFIVFAWISARIYKVGILVSGKKSTFKDLWKWLKQK
ncbi:MAG: ABC transporter permease, partial [Candidatus Cryptobacteroides sp.]